MELEFIFKNEFAEVKYDRENAVLRAEYHGVVVPELGIESFQAVLDVLDDYPLRGAVYNCMDMKGTFTQINPWLKDVFYPKTLPQGYVCWSLATTDIFTKFAGKMLINSMTPKEITANIFGSLDKAEKWTYDFLEKLNS